LWTNDGILARRILHPDWEVPKRYGIKIRGLLAEDDPGFARLRAGMTVEKEVYKPALVRWVTHRTRATWIEVTITEGKFRQLRKMCRACGYQIVKLRRLSIGPIELGDNLNPRCVRPLDEPETAALYLSVGLEAPA
jgi:pseudouridine synthase